MAKTRRKFEQNSLHESNDSYFLLDQILKYSHSDCAVLLSDRVYCRYRQEDHAELEVFVENYLKENDLSALAEQRFSELKVFDNGRQHLHFFVSVSKLEQRVLVTISETERSIGKIQTTIEPIVGLFQNLPLSMLLFQADRVVLTNKRAREIFGQEIVNKCLRDLFDEPSVEFINAIQGQDKVQKHYFELNVNLDDVKLPVEAYIQNKALFDYDLLVVRDLSSVKETERELRKSEMTHRFLTENIREIVFTADKDAVITSINDPVLALFGYKKDRVIGSPVSDLLTFNSKQVFESFLKEGTNKKSNMQQSDWHSIELECNRKNGTPIWVELSIGRDNKSGSGYIGVMRDITEQVASMREKGEQEFKFKAILEGLPVPVIVMSPEWEIENINTKFTKVFGWTINELPTIASFWTKAFPDPAICQEMSAKAIAIVGNAALKNQESETTVFEALNRFGATLVVESRFIYLAGNGIWVFNDITELTRKEAMLQKYATTDELTGVFNRRIGMQILQEQIDSLPLTNKPLSICFIDINRLKTVNDSYGHHEGDEMIKIVVDTLRTSVRNSDSIARLGGDEFLILLPHCNQVAAQNIIDQINEKIRSLNLRSIKPYKIGFSYGIEEYKKGLTVEEFIHKADQMMYIEKRNTYLNSN